MSGLPTTMQSFNAVHLPSRDQVGCFVRSPFIEAEQAVIRKVSGPNPRRPHLGRHNGGTSFREPALIPGEHRMTQNEWLRRIEELEREQRAHYAEGRDAQGDAVGEAIRFLINEGRAKGYCLSDGRPLKAG